MPATPGHVLLAILLVLVSSGCVATSRPAHSQLDCSAGPAGLPAHSVYLIRHGWHTCLAFQQSEISTADWPESIAFAEFDFVEVGWGDRDYLLAPGLNPLVLAKAALLPSSSAIHVAGIRGPLDDFFPESQIIAIDVTPTQMRQICRFIHDSYACQGMEAAAPLRPAFYGSGGVYPSRGSYYLPKTCNVWTAKALAAGGCPVVVPLCTLSLPLTQQAKSFGREIQRGSNLLPVVYPFCNFQLGPCDSGNR
jgi:hypothetical protein